jgi:cytochrome c-type biogenesis protein CcmH/NrfG
VYADIDVCTTCESMQRFMRWTERIRTDDGSYHLDEMESRWLWHAVFSLILIVVTIAGGLYLKWYYLPDLEKKQKTAQRPEDEESKGSREHEKRRKWWIKRASQVC